MSCLRDALEGCSKRENATVNAVAIIIRLYTQTPFSYIAIRTPFSEEKKLVII